MFREARESKVRLKMDDMQQFEISWYKFHGGERSNSDGRDQLVLCAPILNSTLEIVDPYYDDKGITWCTSTKHILFILKRTVKILEWIKTSGAARPSLRWFVV